ncbi:MFS transporter [Candidatus Dojkabacteria bacterium]|uniref:MFS transporter n=1 Tax=Candidatus Dojkabacteria bacterium TaxID=2099670 RepID=A0A955L5B7_9BACT|nr:MFS transporter [Candidatus Dojkabacteria bacterium]
MNDSVYAAVGIYVLLYLGHALSAPFFAKIIAKITTKTSILLGSFLIIVSNIPLIYLESNKSLIFVWLILYISAKNFYFTPYHYYVSRLTTNKHRGKEIGFIRALFLLSSGISPLAVGIVSEEYGLAGMAILFIILMIASLVPLTALDNYKFTFTGQFRNLLSMKTFQKLTKLLSITGLENGINRFWYLYIFLILGESFSFTGTLLTIVVIIGAISSVVLGKIMDNNNRKTFLHFSGYTNAIAWVMRFIVSSVSGIFIAEIFYKLSSYLKDESMETINYDMINHTNHEDILDELVIFREVVVNVALGLSLMMGLIIFEFAGIKATFIYSAFMSLLFTRF